MLLGTLPLLLPAVLSLMDLLNIALNQGCYSEAHLLIFLILCPQSDGAAHALSSFSASRRLGCSLCSKAFQSYVCMCPLSTLCINRDLLYSAGKEHSRPLLVRV